MVDGPIPDTAMDTKSEEGDPGGPDDTTPLTEDEQALLDRLRAGEGTGGDESADPPAKDTTLPGAPPAARPDGLDPVFREPTP
ncbi:MAG TPA: hypothetical protein VI357_12885 [Mycobacteriales bacterium]